MGKLRSTFGRQFSVLAFFTTTLAFMGSCGEPADGNPATTNGECASWSMQIASQHLIGDRIKRTKGSAYYDAGDLDPADEIGAFGIEFRNSDPLAPFGVLSSWQTPVPLGTTGTYRGYFSIQNGNGHSWIGEPWGEDPILEFSLFHHTSTYLAGTYFGEVFDMRTVEIAHVAGVFQWSSNGCTEIRSDCDDEFSACGSVCDFASSDAMEIRSCWKTCADQHGACAERSCIAKENLDEIAENFIGRCKKGSILREFPTQYLPETLEKIKRDQDAGIGRAQTAWKLLSDKRFDK
ncbi:MAG: hypothetical protein H0U74_11420 [Bradymonadaceae bacterium]|nr:hypothetical protein [Lujinxingiaceae bacterium]